MRKYLLKLILLAPICIILISDVLVNFNNTLSVALKFIAIIYMIIVSFWKGIHISLFIGVTLSLLFLGLHLIITFNFLAGLSDFIRYLFPFAFLIYGYHIKEHYILLRNTIISFLLLTNCFQIITYILIFLNIEPLIPTISMELSDGGVRAAGFMSHFAPFGFSNLIGVIICYFDKEIKHRKVLLSIFTIFMLLSTSYKSIFTFLFIIFWFAKRKAVTISSIVLLSTAFILFFPKEFGYISSVISKKIEFYVTEGNSARAESYRVMGEKLTSLTFWLGEGVGSFGGPASIDYGSPVYDKFKFNWYSYGELGTTDTYYPHLFVELGLFGALMYLFAIMLPLFKVKNIESNAKYMILAIYLTLFIDSIMSFALNSPIFLVMSLVFIYPIKFHEKFQVSC